MGVGTGVGALEACGFLRRAAFGGPGVVKAPALVDEGMSLAEAVRGIQEHNIDAAGGDEYRLALALGFRGAG